MEKNKHIITIESRNNITISGVTDMGAYSDEEIEIDTTDGFMIISGEGLNVSKLDVESGICSIYGRIDSVVYSEKNSDNSLFRRIFKW